MRFRKRKRNTLCCGSALTPSHALPAAMSGRTAEQELGERIHMANLRLVAPFLSRPGLWRLELSDVGEIVSIRKARGPLPRFCFSMRTTADGCEPTFGSLERIGGPVQPTYVPKLMEEIRRITRATELADRHVAAGAAIGGERADRMREEAQQHIRDMTEKLGGVGGIVPTGKTRLQAEAERTAEAEAEARAAYLESERRAALEEMGAGGSGELFPSHHHATPLAPIHTLTLSWPLRAFLEPCRRRAFSRDARGRAAARGEEGAQAASTEGAQAARAHRAGAAAAAAAGRRHWNGCDSAATRRWQQRRR